MTAHVCKKCKDFDDRSHKCKRTGKQTSKWNDWCKEREAEWNEWRLSDGG